MKKNSIKTRLVQTEVLPGRPHENCANMLNHIGTAISDGIELIVFPEMAVPGYLLGDEWEHESFIRECERCTAELTVAAKGIIAVFGNVGVDWYRRNEDGRVRKYNALFLAEDGILRGPDAGPYDFAIKTLMPNYREFDESRHFFDLRKLAFEENKSLGELLSPITTSIGRLGCMLCEDAWDSDYAGKPLSILADKNSDLFVNISSSPFTADKNSKRNRVFSAGACKFGVPLLYVNNVGIQNNGKTIYTFDGSSCIYDTAGHQIAIEQRFTESVLSYDVPLSGEPFGDVLSRKPDGIAEIYEAISYGTERFMHQCGVKRVTIGISGGIDSSVVAAIYGKILAPEDLLLVNMPSRFNSDTTKDLALQLASNLGCRYTVVPIEGSIELTDTQMNSITVAATDGSMETVIEFSDLMKENIQARDRSARILAAISSAFGGVFTCNGNKSEATVGYATLYGDLCGYLANIGDLWKTEVYALAEHINDHVYKRDVIPRGCIDIPPSAELSNAQNIDEGKGDPMIYPYHDTLFRSWVERWDRATPENALEAYVAGKLEEDLGYEGTISDIFPDHRSFVDDLERWWNMYQGMGLAKRIQAPPVLAVKRRAFGFDHRESQIGARYTRRYQELKAELLED